MMMMKACEIGVEEGVGFLPGGLTAWCGWIGLSYRFDL